VNDLSARVGGGSDTICDRNSSGRGSDGPAGGCEAQPASTASAAGSRRAQRREARQMRRA